VDSKKLNEDCKLSFLRKTKGSGYVQRRQATCLRIIQIAKFYYH
jgi:hypothetical protein